MERQQAMSERNRYLHFWFTVFAPAAFALLGCSTPAANNAGKDRIIALTRNEIRARAADSFPIPDRDIYTTHSRFSGRWRVWVSTVVRKGPADENGYLHPGGDGCRELVFNRSGALLSYKRTNSSPKWAREEYELDPAWYPVR